MKKVADVNVKVNIKVDGEDDKLCEEIEDKLCEFLEVCTDMFMNEWNYRNDCDEELDDEE